MNSRALKSWLLVLACPALLLAQGKPDLLIFDDDDPGSVGYYDASYGTRTAPSSLLLGGSGPVPDKLIIITSNRYSGNDAGVIQWTSAPNGNWGMFIASVLWQGKDASAHDSLVFFLNGPVAIASSALPKVNLESTTNVKATGVDLETYLSAGVDNDPATWQRVSIPLTAFQPFGTSFLSIFKDVNFTQKLADNVQHTIWIDNIRIIAKVAFVDSSASQVPARVVTRSGDQSVVLHWNRNLQSNLSGFNIYRASSRSGPYAKVSTSLSVSPGFVDFAVTNDQARWYYIRSVTPQGESASSDTVVVSAKAFAGDDEFLDYVEATAFDYFWYET
ncbi:MAG: glycoside hydrolase family 16, partial [Bacteroidetes bacterium]|nr:glycoside hydrolase family 16 [Bacteroidota bacterium]